MEAEDEKVVIEGNAKTVKKPATKRIFGSIVSEDDKKSIKETVTNEIKVLAMSILNTLLFHGRADIGAMNNVISKAGRVAYNLCSEPSSANNAMNKPKRASYPFCDIELESRQDAENLLAHLRVKIRNQGFVSVGQMHSMARIPTESTDFDYGWYSLNEVPIVLVRGGWRLELPQAVPLTD